SGAGNRWTLIAAIIPAGVVTTHTIFCLRTTVAVEQQHYLCGLFNSFVLNVVVRLLMGAHVTTSLVEQLPVPPWTDAPLQRRIARLAARLARGSSGRAAAALHCAVAQLYDVPPDVFALVLDRFPLVPAEDRRRALDLYLRYSPRP